MDCNMKLYDIPRGSKLKARVKDEGVEREMFVTFHRIDGAYSYCTIDGMEGYNVVHIQASSDLRLSDDGTYYEFI